METEHRTRAELQAMVKQDYNLVADFLGYLQWLSESGVDVPMMSLHVFMNEALFKGRYPSDVADDLGLPQHPDWGF